ncbi:hypothetical protein J2Z42_002052 [Clostridium algifaecis]|uniref:Uncharacterized protein n=1 Tax=Clostridium algifaecis TaxID=1472040 RepID=A0ABS4KTI3_9CLOT|nr:hypothetical protein [Clostridium algifaecis]MBP2033349.1 hypothetical protein [Clostridium algifaecis]
MIEKMHRFFQSFPDTPPIGVKGDYRCSVHYKNTYRLDKAKEQYSLPIVDIYDIINYTNDFLEKISIVVKTKDSNKYNPLQIDYKEIKRNNELVSVADIVWMKFTNSGHLGVVATSNDINFDIPLNENEYDKKEWRYNPYKRKNELVWKYTSSGILIHQLGEYWDTSFVLVFPLSNIPKGYNRGDIEKAVGNYLIHKGVPIIDFYSHNY